MRLFGFLFKLAFAGFLFVVAFAIFTENQKHGWIALLVALAITIAMFQKAKPRTGVCALCKCPIERLKYHATIEGKQRWICRKCYGRITSRKSKAAVDAYLEKNG